MNWLKKIFKLKSKIKVKHLGDDLPRTKHRNPPAKLPPVKGEPPQDSSS